MARKRANGEGSFYLRRNGRWEGSVMSRMPDGVSKRVYAYGTTRAEAKMKLFEKLDRIHRRLPVRSDPEDPALTSFLEGWLPRVKRDNRPGTYVSYISAVNNYLKPELGHLKLSELTLRVMQRWFDEKAAEDCTPHLLRQIRSVLSVALAQAEREGLVGRNLVLLVKLPSYKPGERPTWSQADSRHFLFAVTGHPYYAAFAVLLAYGLRRGEVLGLQWGDIDFEHGMLRVRRQLQRIGSQIIFIPAAKTEAGHRSLALTDDIRGVLLRHRQECLAKGKDCSPDALVFTRDDGSPHDPTSFSRTFRRLIKAYGLPDIRLHDLRHTVATMLKDLGLPVRDAQHVLGHADVMTTQRIYQHATPENCEYVLSQLSLVLFESPENRTKGQVHNGASVPGVRSLMRSEPNAVNCGHYCRQAAPFLAEDLRLQQRWEVGSWR